MGYPIKIQLIDRADNTQQWYVNLPCPIAQALQLQRGESFEWTLQGRGELRLRRLAVSPSATKKGAQS